MQVKRLSRKLLIPVILGKIVKNPYNFRKNCKKSWQIKIMTSNWENYKKGIKPLTQKFATSSYLRQKALTEKNIFLDNRLARPFTKLFSKKPQIKKNLQNNAGKLNPDQPTAIGYNQTQLTQQMAQLKALTKKTQKSIRTGNYGVEAKLDLHGLKPEQAIEQLDNFLFSMQQLEFRKLLIVTGKGKGIMRKVFLDWSEQQRQQATILALLPAHAKHGGAGAYYLLLRKKK